MTDTTSVFKITVVGTILALAFGQGYEFKLGGKRYRPFFVEAPPGRGYAVPNQPIAGGGPFPVQPGLAAGNRFNPMLNPSGFGSTGRAGFNGQIQSPLSATGPQVPALTTTTTTSTTESGPDPKLIDTIVNAIVMNHQATTTTTTTPPPTVPAPPGPNPAPVPQHTHDFHDLESGTVVTHTHGPNQPEHVHIVGEDNGGPEKELPQFLVGANTKTGTKVEENNVLTALPVAKVREQIPPPPEPTRPVSPSATPADASEEEDEDEEPPKQNFTHAAPPNTQIPAPSVPTTETTDESRGTSVSPTPPSLSVPSVISGALDPFQKPRGEKLPPN